MTTKFSRTKLAEEILKRLNNGEPPEKISRQAAAYLIDKDKTADLNSLLRDCLEIKAKTDGIVEVTATTAFPISSEEKRDIENIVKARYKNVKKVIIHEKLDSNVIGGISLTIANSQLDATVKSRLNKLRTLVS